MKVIVHLGEPFWRTVKTREVELAVPEHATASVALAELIARHPALAPDMHGGEAQPAIFVGDEAAQPDTPLFEGAKTHLVWPVSGG